MHLDVGPFVVGAPTQRRPTPCCGTVVHLGVGPFAVGRFRIATADAALAFDVNYMSVGRVLHERPIDAVRGVLHERQ